MESLVYTERFYDEDERDDIYNRLSGSTRCFSGGESGNEGGGVSTNTNAILHRSSCNTHFDASGEHQHHNFCCADPDALIYEEVYYDEVVQNDYYEENCSEPDPMRVGHLDDDNSGTNSEDNISEIVERLIRNIPQNFGETQDSVLNEDTDLHDTEFEQAENNMKKVTLLLQNLKRIIRVFKDFPESCDKFLKMYPTWSSNRRKIISELKEIAEDLDKTRLECNIARIIAAAGGTVGGTLGVVGAGLTPVTGGLSGALIVAGCAISLTGGSAALGTAVREIAVLQNKVKKVQTLLKRDKQFFQHISQLLQHASEYMDSVSEIFDFNVFTQFLTDLQRVFRALKGLAKEKAIGSSLTSLLNSFQNGLPAPVAVGIAVVKNRKFVNLLKELILLHHDNPLVFESIAMTTRIFLGVGRTFADVAGTDVLIAATGLAKVGTASFSAALRRALSQGLLAAVGLAVDVTSLILTSIDTRKGSKCPKAQEVREISEKLSNEFDLVKRIFSELRKSQVR